MTAIAEAIIEQEIVELATTHKTTAAGIRRLFEENCRRSIWRELSYMKHECVICGQVIEGEMKYGNPNHRRNTNFGRVSHGKKHINDGSAFSVWGGVDGVFVMPSRAEVVREIEKTIAAHRTRRELPKLRAERKPYADDRHEKKQERDKREKELIEMIRRDGAKVVLDAKFAGGVMLVQSLTEEIEYLTSEIRVIEAQYDEDTVGQLTIGDH